MLLLRTNAAAGCNSTRKASNHYSRTTAAGSGRSVGFAVVHAPSKDAARNRCLVFATGDRIAAFIDAADSESVVVAPSSVARQLLVYTTEGGKSIADVLPGLTTVAQIRAEIAGKLKADVNQVRLAYAGKELDPSVDDQPLQLMPGINVIAAIHRFQGGRPGLINIKACWNPASSVW